MRQETASGYVLKSLHGALLVGELKKMLAYFRQATLTQFDNSEVPRQFRGFCRSYWLSEIA
ncbi:MAG TPA: hypothetical protein VD932_03930 [Aquabacterium sp.]|nr:hypothetical protein [Aquabacterium sp.]